MSMFCYQCQETVHNTGCTVKGVCGKTEDVANLLDLLMYVLRGVSFWSTKARALGKSDEEVNLFVMEGLFTTVTNVNFDPEHIITVIKRGLELRDKIKTVFLAAYKQKHGKDFSDAVPAAADWATTDFSKNALIAKGSQVGVLSQKNEDIRSLREMLIYGIKGIAAYGDHAYILKQKSDDIFAFMQKGLAATLNDSLTADDLIALVMECGKNAVDVMALLDKANTSAYGKPEITQVNTGLKKGPGILVSGHDLLDMEELLIQTQGKGINIYTHSEMLPANAYPGLKKYKHLAGNFGTSWWAQQTEFEKFKGPILMTTNCLQKPKDSYIDRLYNTGVVGWPGVKHIAKRTNGKPKDFSAIINHALKIGDVGETPGKTITIGFAHDTVMGVADKVVGAIKAGKIKRFFVMAGCDGRMPSREYHTELAKALPKDTVILTAGCAKYRYNMLDLGSIDGIPRVLDSGQCNDSYSWAVIALKLMEVFGAKSINDLPITFNVSWYEQKAVCVLLALLYLGVKNIRLCPSAPGFASPNVLKVLVDKFDIKVTGTVDADLPLMLAGK